MQLYLLQKRRRSAVSPSCEYMSSLTSYCNLSHHVHRWSARANHPLSDSLLGIIEDNPVYKVAFGFDKGDVESVLNGGKKVVEHYRSIARKLFVDNPQLEWTEQPLQ
jgi:hypothetical protein